MAKVQGGFSRGGGHCAPRGWGRGPPPRPLLSPGWSGWGPAGALAPAPTSAPGLSSPSRPQAAGLGSSRCFYDYIVCVGGSDVGVARERAVPGRSFINVTHIMILSAASY